MDEIISYKMCAVKVRNAKLRNYLNGLILFARMQVVNTRQIMVNCVICMNELKLLSV